MRDASNLAVHELRAPLTVASGYASMLLDGSMGPGPDQWSTAVGIIGDKLAAANALVDHLLSLARLENDLPKARREDLDLVAIARAAGARARSRADQLGGTLIVESEDNDEVHGLGDRTMVETVIDNLLNNALLYGGDAPSITVRISRLSGPSISVTDHGRGIDADLRKRVFERSFRVTDQSTPPGSGLGLYLSADLARQQGGSLALDWSEPGKGSTFSLRLPTV